MHRHILSNMLVIALVSFMLQSCSDDPVDSPPLNVPDATITIAELRAMYNGEIVTIDQNMVLFGSVTMDESSGNIYRNVFIEDETAAINVRMDYAGDLQTGEQIRIGLKGTVLGSYNNMLQLDSVLFGKNLISQAHDNPVEPHTTTISQILEGGLQARLIKLEDVQFASSELGRPFANVPQGISENRTLTDCDNNQIIIRTSPFARFADQMVPEGNGSLVAIVSQFGNTWQLLVRNLEEIVFDQERCDTGDPGGSGTFDDPFNVAHAIAYNSGNGVWVEGYMVGVMETTGNTNQPSFSPPFTTQTNLLLADNPEETDDSRILPVQLPVGPIRNALNLAGNPQNKGKLVKIKGNLAAYFVPRPGLREASGYWLDGQGIGDGGIWDNLQQITISDIRETYQGTGFNVPSNTMIKGIVISDRQNENITGRNLHLVDSESGAGIVLRFTSFHEFEMGSLIRVDVSDMEVSRFNGLMQINNIPNSQAKLMDMVSIPDPEETTIASILGNMAHYESRLVRIKNVSITGGPTWRGSNGSLTFNDGTGTITHFTTSYSAFASDAVPSGTVHITAIVSIFNNPQLNIRNLNDVETP